MTVVSYVEECRSIVPVQRRIQDFANAPGVGAPTYDFAKFSRKLHEIERIWAPGGRPSRPLDPPLLCIAEDKINSSFNLAFVSFRKGHHL